jgi:transcriptional regulator with XRE-family HTH domain
MEAIEKNLKDICRVKGLTVTDVANRMGADPSNLLSSIKGNPKLSTLQDIADALQISISELLTRRPEKALGIAIIDGNTYQLSKPVSSTVQLPIYDHYNTLREEIKAFIKKCIEGSERTTKMGLVETMEVFSLIYDPDDAKFFLSLCYADGKTLTNAYDKYEYCNWDNCKAEDDAPWDLARITEEIINDIEGYVPTKLQSKNS